MRCAASRGTRGFTLLEVMVALLVGMLVVALVRAFLERVADHADRVAVASAAADRDGNADRLLRGLAGRAEMSADGHAVFEGGPASVRFSTWCDVPAGWLERCRVTLAFVTAAGKPVLALEEGGAAPVVVRRLDEPGHFLYLRDAAGGGRWAGGWTSAVTAPLAIGVVVDGDTTILRIGERG